MPRDAAERELRVAIVEAARAMNAAGINRGVAGNVSARMNAGFLVTPTGMPYDAMTPEDVVAMTMDGESLGSRVPSSEWRFHRDSTARATICARSCMPIPRSRRRSPVSIAAFRRFTTWWRRRADATSAALRMRRSGLPSSAAHVVAAMADRRACLLAHHGMIAAGIDVASCARRWRSRSRRSPRCTGARCSSESPRDFPTPKWTR